VVMQRLLADNRLAEKAGWDREILAIELQALASLDFEGPLRHAYDCRRAHWPQGSGAGD
jgi:hypothetical protein